MVREKGEGEKKKKKTEREKKITIGGKETSGGGGKGLSSAGSREKRKRPLKLESGGKESLSPPIIPIHNRGADVSQMRGIRLWCLGEKPHPPRLKKRERTASP